MPKKGDRVTMMFSATFPSEVQELAKGEILTHFCLKALIQCLQTQSYRNYKI